MKNILITGAGGFLGNELIKQLIDTKHKIYALTSNKEKIEQKFGDNVVCYSNEELLNRKLSIKHIDVVVHCAFARAYKGGEEVAKSLLFTHLLFEEILINDVLSLINISTQEVYGKTSCPWIEHKGQNPNSIYGTAKFFTELLAQNLSVNTNTYSTSIRLAGLIGESTESRMVNKFVAKAVNNQGINILDGELSFSQLDVRDASSGIIALLSTQYNDWKSVYNLGYTKSYSIQEIASTVKLVGKGYNKNVKIIEDKSDLVIQAELDSSLFYGDTNWKPMYSMEDIVKSIFEYKIKNQR